MSKNYMNDSQASEIVKYISDTMKLPLIGAGGGFAPIGTINFFDASVAPQGWLICDGQTYNITDYPELATYYASVHGSANFYGGNGTTTFAVPDLRGEFLRGTGTNSHTNQGSGANVGVHQDGTEHHDSILNYATDSNKCWLVSGYDINKPDYTGGNRKQFYSTNRDYSATPSRDAYVEALGTEGGSFPNKFTSRPTNTSFLICVKATLSDAEINAFNVYTPREHQVAWWEEEIDGVWKRKPVYEKTIDITLPNQKAWTNIDTIQDAYEGWIVQLFVRTNNTTCVSEYGTINMKLEQTANGTTIDVLVLDEYRYGKPATVTVRYTKTTDQWQTV